MFFKELSKLMKDGATLQFTVAQKGNMLTVAVNPANMDGVQPLIATGSPEELDEKFFSNLEKPIKDMSFRTSSYGKIEKQMIEKTEKKISESSKVKKSPPSGTSKSSTNGKSDKNGDEEKKEEPKVIETLL